MPELRKVFLKDRFGGEIACGLDDLNNLMILVVQTEEHATPGSDPVMRPFVWADDIQEERLLNMNMVHFYNSPSPAPIEEVTDGVESVEGAFPIVEAPKSEEADDSDEPPEFLLNGITYKRGTPDYYAYLDEFHAAIREGSIRPETGEMAPIHKEKTIEVPIDTEPRSPLFNLPRMNNRYIQILENAGITTVKDLASKKPGDLAKIRGIGKVTAQKLITDAKNAL